MSFTGGATKEEVDVARGDGEATQRVAPLHLLERLEGREVAYGRLAAISGRTTKSEVAATLTLTLSRLKALTLSRSRCAKPSSSIFCMPVPSTSQTDACAMFHRPSLADMR
jgi:hypothetical protein